ncbi:type II 3-dehydroquinate dehydratase [Rhodovibrionaceae bacterium A322]
MAETPRVLVLNGPNLNLLGTREPEIYGHETLADLEAACLKDGEALGLNVSCKQSNHEGELVSWIQQAKGTQDGLILNAAAYTHTSVAIMDALQAVDLPVIEVHLSNIHQRETFRHHSYVSKVALGMICGLGSDGYRLALSALARKLRSEREA